MGVGTIIALVVSVVIVVLLYYFLKSAMPLILNGLFGLLVFWLLSYFGILKVPLDIWTFLIAALGGVVGVVAVVILSVLGIPL